MNDRDLVRVGISADVMWDLDVEWQGEGPGVQPGQGGQARPRVVGQVQLPQLRGGRQLVQLLQLVVGQVQLAQPRQLVREAEAPQLVVREAEVSEVAGEEAGLQPLDAVVGEVEAGEAPELVLVPPPGLATQPVLQSAGPHCNQALLSAVEGLLTCYIIHPQKVYVKTSCGIPSHCTVCTVLSAPACDRLEAGEAGEVCEVEAGQGGAGRDLQPGHAAGPRHGPEVSSVSSLLQTLALGRPELCRGVEARAAQEGALAAAAREAARSPGLASLAILRGLGAAQADQVYQGHLLDQPL